MTDARQDFVLESELKGGRVLVVNATPEFDSKVGGLLTEVGCYVRSLDSPEELQALWEDPQTFFDAALIRVGSLDDLKACGPVVHGLRSLRHPCAAAVLAESNGEQLARESIALGAFGFMESPVSAGQLRFMAANVMTVSRCWQKMLALDSSVNGNPRLQLGQDSSNGEPSSKHYRVQCLSENAELSPREREVFGLIVDGLSNLAIAKNCRISERTVKFHVRNILSKTGTSSRRDLMVRLLNEGL